MAHLPLLIQLLQVATKDRVQLALENATLRHQLSVLKRSVARPRIADSDRIFWIMIRRTMREWRDSLVFVKPDTVVRWHRNGYRHYWRRKSAGPIGRPPISRELIALIKRMSRENVTWGAPRIADELAKLGHSVGESTVAKYMERHRPTSPGQSWSTFLRAYRGRTGRTESHTRRNFSNGRCRTTQGRAMRGTRNSRAEP